MATTYQAPIPQQVTNQVVVADIHMPFGSMVTFMVKWAIASIPAFLILFFLGAVAVGILGGVMGGLFGHR